MIRALRFLASTSPADRAIAYGHSAWALALVAAFVVLFAAVTPDRANGAERATALSPYGSSPQAVLPVPASIAFAGEN